MKHTKICLYKHCLKYICICCVNYFAIYWGHYLDWKWLAYDKKLSLFQNWQVSVYTRIYVICITIHTYVQQQSFWISKLSPRFVVSLVWSLTPTLSQKRTWIFTLETLMLCFILCIRTYHIVLYCNNIMFWTTANLCWKRFLFHDTYSGYNIVTCSSSPSAKINEADLF